MKTLFFYENTVFMGNSICETYKHKNLWHETQKKGPFTTSNSGVQT